MRSGLTV